MEIKNYKNVNTDKLIKISNDIFKLNCEEFNKKYKTDIMEMDYKEIEDLSVVKISNTFIYTEIELKKFTVTIFSYNGSEKIYNKEGYQKFGRRSMKEIRILMFLKSLLEKCR